MLFSGGMPGPGRTAVALAAGVLGGRVDEVEAPVASAVWVETVDELLLSLTLVVEVEKGQWKGMEVEVEVLGPEEVGPGPW